MALPYRKIEKLQRDEGLMVLGWWQVQCARRHRSIFTPVPTDALVQYMARQVHIYAQGEQYHSKHSYAEAQRFVKAADLAPWPGGYGPFSKQMQELI